MALIACSSCSVYVRRDEHGCPHCGADLSSNGGPVVRTAAAVLMGLTLAGCPAPESEDEGASSSATDTTPGTDASSSASGSSSSGPATTMSSGSAYGVPPTESGSGDESGPPDTTGPDTDGTTGGTGTGTDTGTDTDTDTDASTGGTDSNSGTETGSTGISPDYGAPATG